MFLELGSRTTSLLSSVLPFRSAPALSCVSYKSCTSLIAGPPQHSAIQIHHDCRSISPATSCQYHRYLGSLHYGNQFSPSGTRWLSLLSTNMQKRKAVVEKKTTGSEGAVTLGRKVVQTGKDVSYAGIIVVGIGVTAIMFYTVGKELFSSKSPNGVYTKALKQCKNDPEIQDVLGLPIKGYGEMTRRKRRRHVSHLEYTQEGVNFMRMKFYIEGQHRKGTVNLEVKENSSGKYEYRYLFVDLDGYPAETIVLEDNR